MNRTGGASSRRPLVLTLALTLAALTAVAPAAGCGGVETVDDDMGMSDDYRVHDAAGIEILIPAGWDVESSGDIMTIGHPSDEIVLTFMILEDTWEAARGLEALEDEVSRWVHDIESDADFTDTDVNGMPAMYMDANGYADDVLMELGIMLVHTPNDKVLLVFGMVVSEYMADYEDDLRRIMNGLRPIDSGYSRGPDDTMLAGDVRVHDEAGIELTVPSGWMSDGGADDLTIADPDDRCAITFIVMDASDLSDALSALDDELATYVEDLSMDDPSETTVNGMDAVFVDGTGYADGVDVDVGVMVVITPTGKALLVFGMVEAAYAADYEVDIDNVMNSLRPL